MRIVVVAALFFSTAALADVAKPVVVDVPPSPVGAIANEPAPSPAAAPVFADVRLDELAAATAPVYNRSRWLLLLPLLAALAVIWNVDWRERRVKAEVAAARAARAPPRGAA